MLQQVKDMLNSREFQTDAGQIAIAVTTILVTSVMSNLIAKGLNTGLESLMDKIHGTVEVPAE